MTRKRDITRCAVLLCALLLAIGMAGSAGAQCTADYGGALRWPLDNPQMSGGANQCVDTQYRSGNDVGTFNNIGNNMYHAGVDMKSGSFTPSSYNTPVYAAAAGTVAYITRTSDTTTRCDGTAISASTVVHGMGNVVVISHANGKHSLYAHLDCIAGGISIGTSVGKGQRIGTMGSSTTARRDPGGMGAHLHFEVKDNAVLGTTSHDGMYWGYTPDVPTGYSYHDPREYILGLSASAQTPSVIRVNTNGLSLRTGPAIEFAQIGTVAAGQKFVAWRSSNGWYEIDLPNSGGPTRGWIAGNVGGTAHSQPDSGTQIEIYNTGSTGLRIRPAANAATRYVAWDQRLYGTCRDARVWDGQRFVSMAQSGSWYQYALTGNHYSDSASCLGNTAGYSSGWSGEFVRVVGGGGETLTATLEAQPSSGNAPLTVDLIATAGGTATGTINYTVYCNRSDTGTNITAPNDFKIDGRSPDGSGGTVVNMGRATSYSGGTTFRVNGVCRYDAAATYVAKVIVERGALAAQAQATVNVSAAPPPQYLLHLATSNGSTAKSPDQSSYAADTVVTLTAQCYAGYRFDRWEGDLTGSVNPAQVTMNGEKWISAYCVAQTQPGEFVRSDFDGDARSDIFWRHAATGQNALYLMNGGTIAGSYAVNYEPNTSWKVAAIADFNGDRKADVLWRNATTGQNALYVMNGPSIASTHAINYEPNLAWEIVGAADFNGDAKADVLWRNRDTGQNAMYLMDGATIAGSYSINSEPNLSWKIVAADDFNGDGNADILWRNLTTGQNALYVMNGATIAGSYTINYEGNLAWIVAGTGDYNADGNADIVWRNTSTGANALYLMSGATITGSYLINTEPNAAWKIVGTGDYNGDGMADILWRNTSTGMNALYTMSGAAILGSYVVNTEADLNWQVQR